MKQNISQAHKISNSQAHISQAHNSIAHKIYHISQAHNETDRRHITHANK